MNKEKLNNLLPKFTKQTIVFGLLSVVIVALTVLLAIFLTIDSVVGGIILFSTMVALFGVSLTAAIVSYIKRKRLRNNVVTIDNKILYSVEASDPFAVLIPPLLKIGKIYQKAHEAFNEFYQKCNFGQIQKTIDIKEYLYITIKDKGDVKIKGKNVKARVSGNYAEVEYLEYNILKKLVLHELGHKFLIDCFPEIKRHDHHQVIKEVLGV